MSYFERLAAPPAPPQTRPEAPIVEREELVEVAAAAARSEPEARNIEAGFAEADRFEPSTATEVRRAHHSSAALRGAAPESREAHAEVAAFRVPALETSRARQLATGNVSVPTMPLETREYAPPAAESLPRSAPLNQREARVIPAPWPDQGANRAETLVSATTPESEVPWMLTLAAERPASEAHEPIAKPNEEPTLTIGSVEIQLLPATSVPAPRVARPAPNPRARPEAPLAWLTRNRLRGLR